MNRIRKVLRKIGKGLLNVRRKMGLDCRSSCAFKGRRERRTQLLQLLQLSEHDIRQLVNAALRGIIRLRSL